MGGVPRSPKLQSFRLEIELWSMILRKRKGVCVSTKRIQRFMVKTGFTDALNSNLVEADTQLGAAQGAYRLAKKEASMWRNEFLSSLAESRSQRKSTTVEGEEKCLQQVEGQGRQARQVMRALHKLQSGSVTKIYSTNSEGI